MPPTKSKSSSHRHAIKEQPKKRFVKKSIISPKALSRDGPRIGPRSDPIPDYASPKINPYCYCKGQGDRFHNLNVRCGLCKYCRRRIKGIWFHEHEGECWKASQAQKLKQR